MAFIARARARGPSAVRDSCTTHVMAVPTCGVVCFMSDTILIIPVVHVMTVVSTPIEWDCTHHA